MMSYFPPTWQRYFAPLAPSVPTAALRRPVPPAHKPVRRLYGGYTAGSPVTDAGGAAPPVPPRPPVDHRPQPPEPPRRPLEYAWLTWQMPAHLRSAVIFNLRQTFDWRAQYCKPLDAPKTAPEYTRFGLVGEQLVPKGGLTVRKALRAELRESVRVLEGEQPRLERNWLLAMHSTRLGQLCAELEQRGLDVLEEIRSGLAMLWD
jgi:hypothetical protein